MILKGDCIEVMKAMKPNSVDAIVTDPPYGLEFMGKEWDKLWDKRKFGIDEYSKKSFTCSDGSTRKTNPVSRKLNNPNYKAGIEAQLWHSQWLIEAYRVLKPGGSMLVMGGTRTSHRLACAIEDSGFIIKDTLMWIYGSGFPKAQDLGKMIDKRAGKEREKILKPIAYPDSNCWGIPNRNSDGSYKESSFNTHVEKVNVGNGMRRDSLPATDLAKHWDGFKVGGIKPAYEPIIWAVKPPEGSYVDNVLKWGVGAVNVDECRVGYEDTPNPATNPKYRIEKGCKINHTMGGCFGNNSPAEDKLTKGRFPANIILSHHPECVQVGMKRVKQAWSDKGVLSVDGFNPGQPYKEKPGRKVKKHCDSNGYETVESWDCHPDCAVRLLNEQSGMLRNGGKKYRRTEKTNPSSYDMQGIQNQNKLAGDSGGASRFFKQCNYGQEEWLCHEGCTLRMLDEQSGVRQSKWGKDAPDKITGNINFIGKDRASQQQFRGDSGGASRFYYCAKASRSERNAGLEGMEEKDGLGQQIKGQGGTSAIGNHNPICQKCGGSKIDRGSGICKCDSPQWKVINKSVKNNHPTVKPIKLFEWLIKLVTREGQIILDPFIGSGTTAIAAHNTGRKCVGIEKEKEYIEIAKRRATHWRSRPRQLEMTGG